MIVYHVSRRTEYSSMKIFTPRVPISIGDDEDCETPRICVSTWLTGALSAAILSDDIIDKRKPFMVYSRDIPEDWLIKSDVLFRDYGVIDALYTKECWCMHEMSMCGRYYVITSYERDNYVVPDLSKETQVREYMKQFSWYSPETSYNSLLNEKGVDVDELVEKFGLRGMRVFSKVNLMEV